MRLPNLRHGLLKPDTRDRIHGCDEAAMNKPETVTGKSGKLPALRWSTVV